MNKLGLIGTSLGGVTPSQALRNQTVTPLFSTQMSSEDDQWRVKVQEIPLALLIRVTHLIPSFLISSRCQSHKLAAFLPCITHNALLGLFWLLVVVAFSAVVLFYIY